MYSFYFLQMCGVFFFHVPNYFWELHTSFLYLHHNPTSALYNLIARESSSETERKTSVLWRIFPPSPTVICELCAISISLGSPSFLKIGCHVTLCVILSGLSVLPALVAILLRIFLTGRGVSSTTPDAVTWDTYLLIIH